MAWKRRSALSGPCHHPPVAVRRPLLPGREWLLVVWVASLPLALGQVGLAADADPAAVLGLEVAGAWRTAPDLLKEFKEEELCCGRVSMAALAGGVTLATDRVHGGKFSGRWADHPRFPTVHCTQVPHDWSGCQGVSLWVYSEVATGEFITFAAASDSPQTAWQDYFLADFTVDWTGWRQVMLPFAGFRAYESPVGWGQVDAVYLFTKIANRQPNPQTVLYLDDMKLERTVPTVERPPAPPQLATGLPISTQVPDFDLRVLNHPYPETRDGKAVVAPLQYEPYYRNERALFGYYPRFQPGFVSFSPRGQAYVIYGSTWLQTLGADGKWQCRDLRAEVIEPYAREKLGFAALKVDNLGQVNDANLRFDNDGDAYLMCYLEDPTKDWKSRTCLLLHSRDGLKTWTVYKLPYYMARFEKFVGHNTDCLKRPPIILLSNYFAPTTDWLLVPEKQADGTLRFPPPVKLTDQAIPLIPHSGEGSNAVSCGDKVFIVYGRLVVLPGHEEQEGAPAYCVTYDRKTGTLSEPVLIGFGGKSAKDDHNWPVIAVDSQGYLHVIINGHHAPFVYRRSVRPYDGSEWGPAEKVAVATSYCGLVIDDRDTLYTVSRNSDPGYYFRLSLHRKKAGQPWEEPQHLTIPFKPYYHVWVHKLVLDPVTQRLFVAYYSQSPSVCLFRDEYRAFIYTWPDQEKAFLSAPKATLPTGSNRSQGPHQYQFYSPPASEPAILVSDDRGDSWHLATMADFQVGRP